MYTLSHKEVSKTSVSYDQPSKPWLQTNVKILTYFSIVIWFFGTHNTYHLIARDLKNAFFMRFTPWLSTLSLADHFVTEQQQ